MKKIIISIGLLPLASVALACPTCELAQPRYLRGITHGTGPQSQWDLLIISFTAVLVVATFFFSVKWLISPGEKSGTHIKQQVLKLN